MLRQNFSNILFIEFSFQTPRLFWKPVPENNPLWEAGGAEVQTSVKPSNGYRWNRSH